MITTRRSTESSAYAYEHETTNGGVALLEREEVVENTAFAPVEENIDDARARMQDNLDKLLNYDRYSEQVADVQVEETVETTARAFADEDIRPTSTTMQFGDGDVEQFYQELNRERQESTPADYRLNNKGIFVVVMYALVVTVILALITINSGVLAHLSNTVTLKAQELNAKVATYQSIQQEIDTMSSSEYIIDVAENQYGMIKR